MHAEKCPVCLGSGKVEGKQCHGCNGRGWIEVSDGGSRYIPYVPYEPYPWQPPWQPYYSPNTTREYVFSQDTPMTWC